MRSDVFISHASSDVEAAELLVRTLEQRGITCWISTRDIGIGEDYAEAIIEGIRGSRALITLLSRSAIRSRNVTREVERAHALNIDLLTVRLENVTPTGSLEYFLASRQFIDAFPSLAVKAETVALTVVEALGESRSEARPPLQPSINSRDRWGQPLPIIAGVAGALLLAVIALFVFTRSDDEPDVTQPAATAVGVTSTTTPDDSSTTAAPGTPLVELIGPTQVGPSDNSWFWLDAPDDATVTYNFGGTKYDVGRAFWIRPDVDGPGSFSVTATGQDLDFRQDVEYLAVPRNDADNGCFLMTNGEVQDLLQASLVTRIGPELGANSCDWSFTSGDFEGVVSSSWHRAESGSARLRWFLADGGGKALSTNLAETVYRGVGSGNVVLMAESPHGLAEVSLPGTLDDVEAVALDVLRLLVARLDPNLTAPSIGCDLLTARDLELLIGVKMTQQPVTDPHVCFYNSDVATGLVVSISRTDAVDPVRTLDLIQENESGIVLEFREVAGVGDNAVIGESSIIAILTAVQGDTSVAVSVGKTVSNHDVSALAIQLATAALGLI